MKQAKLPGWLQKLVAVMGGAGLFAVAFFDSSILSFPFVTDGLVIQLSIAVPAKMPNYAAMAAAGSLCNSQSRERGLYSQDLLLARSSSSVHSALYSRRY